MSAPKQQWLLKVIAGPHQGAEIGLYEGKTLVGSDDECDVVLHDVLVAPQHVEFELSSTSGITVAPLGGRVFIHGKRVREARQAWPAFTFLSLGGSHLVLGPAGQAWPLLSAADIPELEKEVEAPEVDPKGSIESKATSTEAIAPSGVTPLAPVGAAPQPALTPASRLGPILGILAGVLLLLGWAIVYNDFFSTQKNSAEPQKEVTDAEAALPITRVKAVVKELGLVESIQVDESAGRLTVSGYVDTESRQRELQAALRASVPGLRTKIYSLEKIASTARSLLEAQRLPLTVSSLSEGALRISGKLASAEPWIRMKQTLLAEVPGINDIQDDVEIEPQRTAIAPALQTSFELPQKSVEPAASVVTPSAVTPPSNPPAADSKTETFLSPDSIDTPEATVAAVRGETAGLGYIRLSTGGVYFAGARLPYGGTIDQIDAGTVTIIEKGQRRTLRPGDKAMKDNATIAP